MALHGFVFSRLPRIVLLRHGTFWTAWILFYTLQAFLTRLHTKQMAAGINWGFSILSVSVTTLVDMAYVYSLIYILIPQLLFRNRFHLFFVSWLLLTFLTAVTFRWVDQFVMYRLHQLFHFPNRNAAPFLLSVFKLATSVGFEGCLAAAIILGKHWYKSNRSLMQMRSQKTSLEENLKKRGRMPATYFVVLNLVKDLIQELEGATASEAWKQRLKEKSALVIAFADAYFKHTKSGTIRLDREVAALRRYLQLKAFDGHRYHIEAEGDATRCRIPVNVVLPLAMVPYKNTPALDGAEPLRVSVVAADAMFSFKITWHTRNNNQALAKEQLEILHHVKNAIELHYPQSHSLSVRIAKNKVGIELIANVNEAI